MVPSMQYGSLQALSVSDNDLLLLTGIGLWDPFRQGLSCCLASKNKQVTTGANSLITKLHTELSKVHDYTCIGQLFCLIAQAIEQAASVQQCEAIWVSCLPILTAVANHLPHTCMHSTEAELADTVETCCALLRVCMKSPNYLLQQSLNGDGSMKWWHSWLARVSIGKVIIPYPQHHQIATVYWWFWGIQTWTRFCNTAPVTLYTCVRACDQLTK